MIKQIVARMIMVCMLFGMLQSDATSVRAAEQVDELSAETEQKDDLLEEDHQAENLPVIKEEQTDVLDTEEEQTDAPDVEKEQTDAPNVEEEQTDALDVEEEQTDAEEEQTVETEKLISEQLEGEEISSELELKSDEAIRQMDRPTGLILPNMIDAGEISPDQVFGLTEKLEADIIRSYVYLSEWDKCSTNYFYNQLAEEEKLFWDELDAMCLKLLCTTEDAQKDYFGFRTQYVDCRNIDIGRAKALMMMFRYSNPQYYFVDPDFRSGHDNYGNYFVGFGLYTAFGNGNSRQTATLAVKDKYNEWLDIIGNCQTEAEKVKVIHDLVVNKVEYNQDIYDQNFTEDISYTQSVYSVFCMDKTVCAGYALSFEMMCNAAGIDCIAVTSNDHGWNKVRVNDSWYNVDCTWADQGSVNYIYFERNDAYYDSDSPYYASSHAESAFWLPYLPVCTLDSNATYSDPGVLPVISQTTAAPVISVTEYGNGCAITLSSQTPGAVLYYTINGTTPTPAYTKSLKYESSFIVDRTCVVKAVAVCDTYWDSTIVSSDAVVLKETYTITFESNGASSGRVKDITYCEGQNITVPPNDFVRNGYEFIGWNTKADGTGKSYAVGQNVSTTGWTGDITLYAQWRAGTDSENKACFIALLYENVLERRAEDSEIQHWIQELENGRTGADVAYLFVFSKEFQNKGLKNGDFLERLYMSLMGRASDPAGKRDWITHLDNGVSREYVLKQFIESAEFTLKCESYRIIRGTTSLSEARDQNYDVTRFVARNYTQFLGRNYETDGLNYWCDIIQNRERTMQEVAFGFVFSAECGNKKLSNEEFVQMLYRGCFDREGEKNGVAYWSQYLDSGEKDRLEVFYGFANSREFDNMVRSYGL